MLIIQFILLHSAFKVGYERFFTILLYIGDICLFFSFVLEVPGKEIKRNKIVAVTDDSGLFCLSLLVSNVIFHFILTSSKI